MKNAISQLGATLRKAIEDAGGAEGTTEAWFAAAGIDCPQKQMAIMDASIDSARFNLAMRGTANA
jgi:hypothetical protein